MEKFPNGSKQEVTSLLIGGENVHKDVGTTLKDSLATQLDVEVKPVELSQQQGLSTLDFKCVSPQPIGNVSEKMHDVSLQPECERCREINDKHMSYRNRMELNLMIIKEKITTTDELIKKYRRKCQENDQNYKKVVELTEKIKRCYSENGTLRVELEKAKAANEPLKKSAMRLENEKKLMDSHAESLMSKLKDTQRHLEDVQASMSATDQMSSSLHARLKKKERDIGNLETRLQKKEKTIEKLLAQLKDAKVARRQSDIQARKASKEVEKIRKKLPSVKDGDVTKGRNNSKKGGRVQTVSRDRGTDRPSVLRTRPPLIQDADQQESEERDRENDAINNEGGYEFINAPDSGSEQDEEIAAIFERSNAKLATQSDSFCTGDVLANFAIPSPPLSPIPPSPAPLKHVKKTGLDVRSEHSNGDSRVLRRNMSTIRTVIDSADVNDNEDDNNDGKGAFGLRVGNCVRESENNGSDMNYVSDLGSNADEVSLRRHDSKEEVMDLEEGALDMKKDQQLPVATVSKYIDDSIGVGCIEPGDLLLKRESVVDNGNHAESLESGKVVDNILGVVSSDESDSDDDQSGDHNDASEDEDYSSFDSSDPRYDFVNQTEDGEVKTIEKSRTETDRVFEAKDDTLIRNSKGSDIGGSVGLAAKPAQETVDEKEKSDNALGEIMESPKEGELMNLSQIGRFSNEESSAVNISKTSGLVSSEKEGVFCKQGLSNKEDLVNLTAGNICAVHKQEEHSVLEISTNINPMKDLREDHPFEETYKVNKEKQNGLRRNESELCRDFDVNVGKRNKRLFDSTEESNSALRNVCKRSRSEWNINASDVKEMAGLSSHEISKEIIDICVKEGEARVSDEIVINAKDEPLAGKSFDTENYSIGEGNVTKTSTKLCEMSSVSADKNDIISCDDTLEGIIEVGLERADCNKTGLILSESPCEVIRSGMKSKKELLPVKSDLSQVEFRGEYANSKTESDDISVSLTKKGNAQGNKLSGDSSCSASVESLHVNKKIDRVAIPSDSALTRDEGCRSPDRSDMEKVQNFGANKNAHNQSLKTHAMAVICGAICDGPSIKGSEERSGLKDRINADESSLLQQNPSNNKHNDNDVVSKHCPDLQARENAIQAEYTTGQSFPADNKSSSDAGANMEIELCLESIISEETDNYPQISPLPPSPGVQRPRSISPLPMTPLPGVVSPVVSPSQLLSPPSLRESTIDSDRLPCIAKPRATLSSYSVRMLDFLSTDDEELEQEGPVYPSGKMIKQDGTRLSSGSSSSFAVVTMQTNDSLARWKAPLNKQMKNAVKDTKSDIGDKNVQTKVYDEDVSETGTKNDLASTEKGDIKSLGSSSNVSPTKLYLRKRKLADTGVGRSLRSSDKRVGDRSGTSVGLKMGDAKKAGKTAKRGGSIRLNPDIVSNKEEKSDGRRCLRSNTIIVDVSKNMRRVSGRHGNWCEDTIANVKGMKGKESQKEQINMNLESKVDWPEKSTNRNDAGVIVENTKDRSGINCYMEQGHTCEKNDVTGTAALESSPPLTKPLQSSNSALDQLTEEPGPSARLFDNVFEKKQSLDLVVGRSAVKSALEAEETVKRGLLCRDRKQSEVEYAQICIESLQDPESLREVVRQFSLIRNISSATSIVSAIVGYLKTVKTDSLLNVYRRLHENELEVSNSTLVRDVFVEKFTKCPELTKKELLIVQTIEECAKVPQLNAIMKRIIHFLPKAILREHRSSDESLLSLCRTFTMICRRQNEIKPLKEFLFDVATNPSLSDILDKIVIICFCVWPTVFTDISLAFDKANEAVRNTVGSHAIFLSVQVLAICQSLKCEDSQIHKSLLAAFNGSSIGSDHFQWLCNALLIHLKNEELQKELDAQKRGDILGPNASDIVKSFDMLLLHKGWKWCNNYLVGDQLWGIFRQWSQQSSESILDSERVHDATIVTAIRIIGRICCSAVKDGYKSFDVIVKMCCGILSKSRQISKIPQPVQLAAAYTLLDISSTDTRTIQPQLSQWLQSAAFDVPIDLRSQITTFTYDEQF